jgi:hypothetical protein
VSLALVLFNVAAASTVLDMLHGAAGHMVKESPSQRGEREFYNTT